MAILQACSRLLLQVPRVHPHRSRIEQTWPPAPFGSLGYSEVKSGGSKPSLEYR